MNDLKYLSRIVVLGVWFGLLAANLAACQSKEIELPFDPIEQEFIGAGEKYQQPEPKLVVIDKPEDVIQVENFISPAALAKLRELDYGKYIAIVVFNGIRPHGYFAAEVQRIIQQNNRVIVTTLFIIPPPNSEKILIVTSPYQVVRVKRPVNSNDHLEFVLQGTEVPATVFP